MQFKSTGVATDIPPHTAIALREQALASGLLPHGAPGELEFAVVLQEVWDFAARLAPYLTSPLHELNMHLKPHWPAPLVIDIKVGDFRIQGQLQDLGMEGMLLSRIGKLRAKDYLRLWVQHLLLCCHNQTTLPVIPYVEDATSPPVASAGSIPILPISRYVAENGTLQLNPVPDAAMHLLELLQLYWQALTAPLAFFPESSLACCKHGIHSREFKERWDGWGYQASTSGNQYTSRVDSADVAVKIAFRGTNPIGEEFVSIAQRVFAPILKHCNYLPYAANYPHKT